MTDILLLSDDSDVSVVVSINQKLIHRERWWILSGLELVAPHEVEDQMLVVVVGMMYALTVVTNQVDLHRRITAAPWPCAVHVPPRQNLTFTHGKARGHLTQDEVAAWDRLRIRVAWQWGMGP